MKVTRNPRKRKRKAGARRRPTGRVTLPISRLVRMFKMPKMRKRPPKYVLHTMNVVAAGMKRKKLPLTFSF